MLSFDNTSLQNGNKNTGSKPLEIFDIINEFISHKRALVLKSIEKNYTVKTSSGKNLSYNTKVNISEIKITNIL